MHVDSKSTLGPSRRQFFQHSGVAMAALATLLRQSGVAPAASVEPTVPNGLPHHAPQARRVIYLFQSGGPSQLDLFDVKPQLERWRDNDLPAEIRQGQRLTGMTSTQDRFPIAPTMFRFRQHGASGAAISELMPHLTKVADRLCFNKSMQSTAINHAPAITFFQPGFT